MLCVQHRHAEDRPAVGRRHRRVTLQIHHAVVAGQRLQWPLIGPEEEAEIWEEAKPRRKSEQCPGEHRSQGEATEAQADVHHR